MFSYPRRTWCAPWMVRGPVGRERGQDQRRAGAQVADLELGAVQRRGPVIAA